MGDGFHFNHFLFLLQGLVWTCGLTLIGFVGGGTLGAVVALARVSPVRAIRLVSFLFVQIIQGTPLLVIMFMSYFGVSSLGYNITPLTAASISLTVYAGAYLGEIWRGCIEAIPRAQWEAAEGLALSRFQRMTKVILPQTVKIATPPTVGFSVQIIKNTSLASVIGFVEVARAGQMINNTLFMPFYIYLLIASMYFALCFPLSKLSRRLEASITRTLVQQS